MNSIKDLSVGSLIEFVGCGTCVGKHRCFFCMPKVKKKGKVLTLHLDFDIPTVEVQVKGSKTLLELSEADLNDPEFILKVY